MKNNVHRRISLQIWIPSVVKRKPFESIIYRRVKYKTSDGASVKFQYTDLLVFSSETC